MIITNSNGMQAVTITQITYTELESLIENSIEKFLTSKNSEVKTNSKPLSQKELAEFLGLSDQTVTRWRNKGRIPFIKIGPTIRYNLDEVMKTLEVSKIKSF